MTSLRDVAATRASRTTLIAILGLLVIGVSAERAVTSTTHAPGNAALNSHAPDLVATGGHAATDPSAGLRLERNVGQGPNGVDYVGRGQGYSVSIDASTASIAVVDQNAASSPLTSRLTSTGSVVRMQLMGGQPTAPHEAQDPLGSRSNYLMGAKKVWHPNVAQFGRVAYFGVYPGVDVAYSGAGGQLEYTFTVAPRADPSAIVLKFDGAQSVRLDGNDLVIATPSGNIREHAPSTYQDGPIGRRAVPSSFVVNPDSTVGFEIGDYDHSRALVIDPTVSFSTYIGGSSDDDGQGIAVDTGGNTYVTGLEESADFPTTTGAFQTSHPVGVRYQSYVAKFSPTGSLVYSTLIGGTSGDAFPGAIAVDASGDAVIGGGTSESDFPTTPGAFETTPFSSGLWGFVAKLNASGTGLLYSSYVGDGLGVPGDTGVQAAVTLDPSGAYYFEATTGASDFPVSAGAVQATEAGNADLAVVKLTPSGALQYATYLGGSGNEQSRSIAADAAGNAYVEGLTTSADFPVTPGAFQTSNHGGDDLFISKLSPTGTGLAYSTYLGGSSDEAADVGDSGGVAIDSSGDAYVTAGTSSSDFPVTPGAFQTTMSGGSDAFVTELNPAGTGLVYSTYLGGSGANAARGIALIGGNAVVAGTTTSSDFPTQSPTQASLGGSSDAFVAEVAPGGDALIFSTYLGGTGTEVAKAVAASATARIVVTGATYGSDFPTVNPFQSAQAGPGDGFVASINARDLLSVKQTASAAAVNGGQQFTYSFSVNNDGSVGPATSVTLTDPLPAGVTFVAASSSQGTCSPSQGTVTCALGSLPGNSGASVSITVTAPNPRGGASATLVNTGSVAAAESDPAPADNQSTTTVYVNVADMSIAASAPGKVVSGDQLTYTLSVANNGPAAATGVKVVDTLPSSGVSFSSATATQGACTQGGVNVTCTLGNMAADTTASVSIATAVSAPFATSLNDTATVSADQIDLTPANNTAGAVTIVNNPGCGEVITSSTKLTTDIGPCFDDGVIIGSDHITLNLNGHSISGPEADPTLNAQLCPCDDIAGVRLPDRVGVTIENGSVSGFAAGVFLNSGAENTVQKLNIHDNFGPNSFDADFGDGVFIQHSAANHVLSNTIKHNGLYDGVGIFGLDSDDNVVQGNTITDQAGRGVDMAAFLELGDPRRGNSLHGNQILQNTVVGNVGTGISSQSNVGGQIVGNDIERNGLDPIHADTDIGIGVSVDLNAVLQAGELVENNRVIGNGFDGIQVNAIGNQILNNVTNGNNVARDSFSFDLDDNTSSDCSTNTWSGNTYGPAGVNPSCLAQSNTGPPSPGGSAPSVAQAPTQMQTPTAGHQRHEVR